MAHDAVASATALLLSFFLRFDMAGIATREEFLRVFLPLFVIYAAGTFSFFHLYRSKWRFASLPDLVNIFKASTMVTLSLLALDYAFASSGFHGGFMFGKITLFLYWLLQMFALGAGRILYRYYRYTRASRTGASSNNAAALLVGNGSEADMFLRAIESGAVTHLKVLGILSPAKGDKGQLIRMTQVLGFPNELEQVLLDLEQNQLRPHHVILLPSIFKQGLGDELLSALSRFDIPAQRLPVLDNFDPKAPRQIELLPLEIEDLLFRESAQIDYQRLRSFIQNKRIVVTGGAGSIGTEICIRVLEFGCADLLVIDHAEGALFSVQQKLNASGTGGRVVGHIADIRNLSRLEALLEEFKPDYVFHAAALKHVPMIEKDWIEGLTTNVLGTVNLCQAALKTKAKCVVNISTDKAVEPVSILGLSKKFGESYAATLDRESGSETRFISVRFGNVLGSSGSVVPLFKSQISSGGPVTVTHQSMVRYFMTAREACDLVLTSASHAIGTDILSASVYVLDMGQPVRILDLAERMIRMSGHVPHQDIDITFSGIRPGERLHETLFASDEEAIDVGIAGISAALGQSSCLSSLQAAVRDLQTSLEAEDRAGAVKILQNIPAKRTAASHLNLVKTAG